MSTIHLLCGKTGSGKTTFARKLESDRRAVWFSADEWMIRLYGRHMSREDFDRRLDVCKEMIYGIAGRLLQLGLDVVLDFGFWQKAERTAVRRRFETLGAACVLYYLEVSDEELLRRLKERNASLSAATFEITEPMFAMFSSLFEAPDAEEGAIIISG